MPDSSSSHRRAGWPLSHKVIRAVFANFFLFAFAAMFLGGDAVNGKAEGQRYFLADHGKLTEVSYAVWLYSRMHVYAVWLSVPIMAVAMSRSRRHPVGRTDSQLVALTIGGMVVLLVCEMLKGGPGPASPSSAFLALGAGAVVAVGISLFFRFMNAA